MTGGCPTCGRGPFWVVVQGVPEGEAFVIEDVPATAGMAGVIQPGRMWRGSSINNSGRDWPAGTRVEQVPDTTRGGEPVWQVIR